MEGSCRDLKIIMKDSDAVDYLTIYCPLHPLNQYVCDTIQFICDVNTTALIYDVNNSYSCSNYNCCPWTENTTIAVTRYPTNYPTHSPSYYPTIQSVYPTVYPSYHPSDYSTIYPSYYTSMYAAKSTLNLMERQKLIANFTVTLIVVVVIIIVCVLIMVEPNQHHMY
eukprot:237701_1